MKKKRNLPKADLHSHTSFTDGFASPQEMALAAEKRGLSFLAITDHNQIRPAQIAQNFARRQGLKVKIIIGEEVYTQSGEVIGLFLKKRIPKLLPVEKTCQLIKKQGGLVLIPHPFRLIIGMGLNLEVITKLARNKLIDLIEIANLWDYPGLVEKRRRLLNGRLKIPHLANSDSHSVETLALYYNRLRATSLEELKEELLHGRVSPIYPPIKKKEKIKIIGRVLVKKMGSLLKGKRKFSNRITLQKKAKTIVRSYFSSANGPRRNKKPPKQQPRH